MTVLRNVMCEEKAQDLAEYGIALAVIGAGAAAAALAIAANIEVLWETANTVIGSAAS